MDADLRLFLRKSEIEEGFDDDNDTDCFVTARLLDDADFVDSNESELSLEVKLTDRFKTTPLHS